MAKKLIKGKITLPNKVKLKDVDVKSLTLQELMNVDLTGYSLKTKEEVLKALSRKANQRITRLKKDTITKRMVTTKHYKKGFKTSIKRKGKYKYTKETKNKKVMQEINRVREFLNNETSTVKGAKNVYRNQVEALLGEDVNLTTRQRKRFFNVLDRIKELGDVNAIFGSVTSKGSPIVAKAIYESMFDDNNKLKDVDDILDEAESKLDEIYKKIQQQEQDILDDIEDDEEQDEYEDTTFYIPRWWKHL